MTSKISFTKLCIENMKRRIGLLVITILTYFVSMPLAMMLSLQDISENYITAESMERQLRNIFSTFFSMGFNSVLAAGFAVLCAVAGFAWLFSKKKVDLYHSIPVKREKLFLSIYLNGIIVWLVPYLVSVLVCLAIISGHMTLDGTMLSIAGITLGVNILFFLLIYNLAIVAVMLTGNMINCIFTGGVLFGYAMCVRLLLEAYVANFIVTYYGGDIDFWEELKFSSPFVSFLYVAEEFTKWENRMTVYLTGGAFALYLVQCLVMAVIAGVAALLLYKKRPSEAAGKSIAFEKILNVYRILLVIPLSLGSGLFFQMLVSGSKVETAWMIFGLIFGLVLSHGFIEVLFQMDIKAMFSYKRQLLVTGVVVFLLAFSVKDDWYGMNKSMPDKEDVVSMAVSAGVMDGGYFYYQNEEEDVYYSGEEWILKNMQLTNLEVPYALAKAGMEYTADEVHGDPWNTDDVERYGYCIKYRLDNGKEIVKRYWLPKDEVYGYVDQLYDSLEYKNAVMNVLWEEGAKATFMEIMDVAYTNQELEKEWIPGFLEIYRREYEALSFEDIMESSVVAEISVERYEDDNIKNGFISRASDFPLYSCCEESIQYLADKGVDTRFLQMDLQLEDVQEVRIYVTNGDIMQEMGLEQNEDYKMYGTLYVTDKAEIEKLLPYLVIDKYNYRDFNSYDRDFDVDVTVSYDDVVDTFNVSLLPGSPIKDIRFELREEY